MWKYLRAGLIFCFVSVAASALAGDKIKVYFNHPVNNAVSTGVNAVYSTHIADTVVAYINRAKYTVDVAMYNFSYSTSYADIAGAMNSALSRGVQIRWIYDGSSSNSGLSHLNAAIPTLASPTSSDYGIMHNKVMIIDAGSADPADAVVYTGSMNWSSQQFSSDYNNVVFLQDSALARAYTNEFNLMWGGAAATPNLANSKFGSFKNDLGQHSFTVDGHQVELYFSPSDNTNSRIISTINTANTDFYFGMYTFTYTADATAIVNRKNAGVYVAGIDDSFSDSYSPHDIFVTNLGNNFKVYSGTGIYHNKFMIVDPSNTCSDPMVETGSHNWSSSANTDNDENIVIIHSDTIANMYYQSFNANFTTLGGTLAAQSGCSTGASQLQNAMADFKVCPNPFNDAPVITYTVSTACPVTVSVTNLYGQLIAMPVNNIIVQPGTYSCSFAPAQAGVYFIHYSAGSYTNTQKVVKL